MEPPMLPTETAETNEDRDQARPQLGFAGPATSFSNVRDAPAEQRGPLEPF